MFRTASMILIAFLTLVALPASAHEFRDVGDGQYAIEIGFINEPAFVNQQNGLFLAVERTEEQPNASTPIATSEDEGDQHGGANGVTGLQDTLAVDVIFGDQQMTLPLSPTITPGVYESIFFPTAVGDYTFHVTGTIESTGIDETFTSSPEGFDSVQDVAQYQFPKP